MLPDHARTSRVRWSPSLRPRFREPVLRPSRRVLSVADSIQDPRPSPARAARSPAIPTMTRLRSPERSTARTPTVPGTTTPRRQTRRGRRRRRWRPHNAHQASVASATKMSSQRRRATRSEWEQQPTAHAQPPHEREHSTPEGRRPRPPSAARPPNRPRAPLHWSECPPVRTATSRLRPDSKRRP